MIQGTEAPKAQILSVRRHKTNYHHPIVIIGLKEVAFDVVIYDPMQEIEEKEECDGCWHHTGPDVLCAVKEVDALLFIGEFLWPFAQILLENLVIVIEYVEDRFKRLGKKP